MWLLILLKQQQMLNKLKEYRYSVALYLMFFIISFINIYPHSQLLNLCWMFFAEFFPKAGSTITGWFVFFVVIIISLLLSYGVLKLAKIIKNIIYLKLL